MTDVSDQDVDGLFAKLDRDAESAGYHLNPDTEFTKDLVKNLLVNESRYGYQACPCRLASEVKEDDLDIICPCDYRDADLEEFGACYCALYVSEDIKEGRRAAEPIPERRSPEREERPQFAETAAPTGLAYPVWRCRVCGYLAAREEPPSVCPVCKAKKDRFERFM